MSQTDADVSSGPSNGELIDALYGALSAARTGVQQAMEDLDLTDALADVLWQLAPGEVVPRRELAERLKCDPSNVTFLVDRLEARGLIERSSALTDRRVRAVQLTPAGSRARRRLLQAAAEVTSFSALSASERARLLQLLRRCAPQGGQLQ